MEEGRKGDVVNRDLEGETCSIPDQINERGSKQDRKNSKER